MVLDQWLVASALIGAWSAALLIVALLIGTAVPRRRPTRTAEPEHRLGPSVADTLPDMPVLQAPPPRNEPDINTSLRKVFQSLSFDDALRELGALSPEERESAMAALKLNPAIRTKLRTILSQGSVTK